MKGKILDGRYLLVERLGSGGMGEVWLATDQKLNGREVAIKLLRDDLVGDHALRARFVREIRMLSKIPASHFLVQILDLIDEPDCLGYVMERLQGQNLEQLLAQKKKLDVPQTLRLGKDVASGLDLIHRTGLVHRDIKPSNIWCPLSGPAKILDLGIAKAIGDTALTGTGGRIGTRGYMSPEQARGGEVSAKSDLFCLGIVLQECLTGEPPFGRKNDFFQKLEQQDAAPIHRLRPEVPREVSDLIGNLLIKEPSRRFPESAADLKDFLKTQPPQEPPGPPPVGNPTVPSETRKEPPKWLRRVRIIVVVALLTILGAILVKWIDEWIGGGPPHSEAILVRISDRMTHQCGADDWLTSIIGVSLSQESQIPVHQGTWLPENPMVVPDLHRKLAINILILGEIHQNPSSQIQVRVQIVPARRPDRPIELEAEAASFSEAVLKLADDLRSLLGIARMSDDARDRLKRMLLETDDIETFAKGLEHQRVGDLAQSTAELRKLIVGRPDFVPGRLSLARALDEAGYRTAARQQGDKVELNLSSIPQILREDVEAELLLLLNEDQKAAQRLRNLFQKRLEPRIAARWLEAGIRAGDWDQVDATLAEIDLHESLKRSPQLLLLRAEAHCKRAALVECREAASKAVETAQTLQAVEIEAASRLRLGASMALQGNDEGLEQFHLARQKYESIGNERGVGEVLVWTTYIAARQDDLKTASALYDQLIDRFRKFGNRIRLYEALSNKAVILERQGNYREASRFAQESLEQAVELEDPELKVAALITLGAIAQAMGDLESSEGFYLRAEEESRSKKMARGLASAVNNRAEIAFLRGRLDLAEKLHRESLAISKTINYRPLIAHNSWRLGRILMARDDLKSARRKFEIAIDTFGSDYTEIGLVQLDLARTLQLQGLLDSARDQAEDGEESLRTSGYNTGHCARCLVAELSWALGLEDRANEVSSSIVRESDDDRETAAAKAAFLARRAIRNGATRRDLESLEAEILELESLDLISFAYQLHLVAAELESALGHETASAERLRTLEAAAEQKELLLLARQARQQLSTTAH